MQESQPDSPESPEPQDRTVPKTDGTHRTPKPKSPERKAPRVRIGDTVSIRELADFLETVE
jgi:hypothetical protein